MFPKCPTRTSRYSLAVALFSASFAIPGPALSNGYGSPSPSIGAGIVAVVPSSSIYVILGLIAGCILGCLAYRRWQYRRIENQACSSEIISNAIGDLEGPLTALLGALDWLGQTGNSGKTGRRLLNLARRNAVELNDVVERMRDLELARSGLLSPATCVGELKSLLLNSFDTFHVMAENSDIVFNQECDLPDRHFLFDEGNLGKILDSLFARAAAFAGYEGEVSFRTRLDGSFKSKRANSRKRLLRMELICARNDAAANRVAASKWEASVDLALAKSLLELCGGGLKIKVSSKWKRGHQSKLEIDAYLPVEEVVSAAGSSNASGKPSAREIQSAQGKPVIAVIEDSEDLLSCIRESLENEYSIFGVDSNEDGLSLILRRSPDLVILEAKMQRRCGFELCRRIREDIRTSHLPIIMLAPRRCFEDKVKGMRSGTDIFMAKPINFAFLKSCIQNLILNRKRLRQCFATATPPLKFNDAEEKTFIEKASEIVNSNLSYPDFEVEAFAKAVHLSRSTLNRKLKALTGHSPAAFIREARLMRATVLLRDSSLSVAEVGFQVGFADHSHFTARFKERFKYTPSNYRLVVQQSEKEARFIQAS